MKKPRANGFPVLLMLTLRHDEGELYLEKKTTLPFVPFPGLIIESSADAELDPVMETVIYVEDEGFRVECRRLSRKIWSQAVAIEKSGRDGWSVR